MSRCHRRNLGGPIDPATLPGLELYLRSDQIVGADASTTAGWTANKWPDASGNGRDATLSTFTSPILRTTGANLTPNGKQVVQFQSAAHGLSCTFPGSPIANTLGWTIYGYYKSVALSAGHANYVCVSSSGAGVELAAYTNAGFNGYDTDARFGFAAGATGRKAFGETPTTGVWRLFRLTLSPPAAGAGIAQGFINGSALTNTFTNWTTALNTQVAIGNNPGANSDLEGTLAAVLIFSRAHDASAAAGVELFIHNLFDL